MGNAPVLKTATANVKPKDAALMQSTWKLLESNLPLHAVKFFIRFINKYPYYRKYFQASSSSAQFNISNDARIHSHFRAIITTIGTLVETSINRPDVTKNLITFLAEVHQHLGLELTDFDHFREQFVEYMQKEFTLEMDDPTSRAWDRFLGIAFEEVCHVMQKFQAQETPFQSGETGYADGRPEGRFFYHDMNFWKNQQLVWRDNVELVVEEDKRSSSRESKNRKEYQLKDLWACCLPSSQKK